LPNLLYLKLKGISLKRALRLNKISFKNIILVILITIFAYPLVAFINAIFLSIISIFREVYPSTVPVPGDDIQFIYSFFVIAISPGICEEIMFRGTIMAAYHKLGPKKSIIISGLLFGIFHFTILNFVGPTLLGLLFGVMVYKTNSIYSSIIAHTLNNGIAISLLFLLSKYGHVLDSLPSQEGLDPVQAGKSIIIILIIIILCAFIVFKLIKRLSKPVERYEYDDYIDYGYVDHARSIFDYIPVLISFIIFIYINWRFVLI